MRLFPLVLLATLAVAAASPASAQNDRWQAFPSLRDAQAVTASDDALWVGTDGGVYRYAPATGEIERFTPVEGLSGVDVAALTYDATRDAVWVGYSDGALDRLDATSGEVQSFFEIAQADRFNARGISRIAVEADSLLISTDFGVVVFDAVRGEVSDTYERFGTFSGGIPVGESVLAPLPDERPGLWVGTSEGVAYAPLSAPNLREPSAWTVDAGSPANVLSLAVFGERLFAGTEQIDDEQTGGAFRRRDDGTWQALVSQGSIPSMFTTQNQLVIVAGFRLILVNPDQSIKQVGVDDLDAMQAGVLGPDGQVWVGEQFAGLIALPDLGGVEDETISSTLQVTPGGPSANTILSLDVASDGTVWTGFDAPNERVNGFGRFDGTMWENFSLDNGALPDRAAITVTHVGSFGNVWFGSGDIRRGVGVFQVTPEEEIVQYVSENSTLLQSSSSNPDYIVTAGLDTDEEGRLWVSNRFAALPLHVRSPDGTWTGLDRLSNVPTAITYDKVYVDSFGQKWITGYRGDGFLVLDTGADPLDAADDRAALVRTTGSVGTGLPSDEVNAIVEDRSGRIWLGTDRGLATVFSPGSIFVGDPAQQVTWARTPDGASFFLRDLRIFDIAVDPADRKWLASDAGVWLLNDEGNEVIANFNAENSPLPSNVIVAVDVDEASGAVYFATSGGLYRYDGDALAPSPTAEDLFIYPNPVRADGGALPEIAITGLVDDADVRVLTIDGQVVASFRTRGGSVRWDGRDQRTGDFVPSGVYIVAAAGQNGEGAAYGKIAVIR